MPRNCPTAHSSLFSQFSLREFRLYRYALQDSTDDAAVMFRASSSGSSTTWNPRVIAVDSKSGFGAMTAHGFVVSDSGEAVGMARAC